MKNSIKNIVESTSSTLVKQHSIRNKFLTFKLLALTKQVEKLEYDIEHNLIDADAGIFLKIQRERDIQNTKVQLA